MNPADKDTKVTPQQTTRVNVPPPEVRPSTPQADEIKLLASTLFEPLMTSSCFHGSGHVATIHLRRRVPVLVIDNLVSEPEPEPQGAGVAQPHPDVGSVGPLGPLLDLRLLVTVGDGGQFPVVLPAVIQGLLPGLVHPDQDDFICWGGNGDKRGIKLLTVGSTALRSI